MFLQSSEFVSLLCFLFGTRFHSSARTREIFTPSAAHPASLGRIHMPMLLPGAFRSAKAIDMGPRCPALALNVEFPIYSSRTVTDGHERQNQIFSQEEIRTLPLSKANIRHSDFAVAFLFLNCAQLSL